MASGLQTERWTEEIICPICLEFFTDPVSLDCGQNYCHSCITRSWEKQETNRCAVCQETLAEKNLRVNRALASLAERARKFSLTPTQTEINLQCEKHREELKLLCESDKKLLCLVCRDAREHRDHRFLPIEEAVEIYKDQVKSSLASLAQMKETALQAEAKQNQNISQLKEQASSLQTQVKNDFAKIHQILTDREQRVMIDLRQREEEILQRMETNLREIRSNLDSVQQEISELQTQMKRDGPIFLQIPSVHHSTQCSQTQPRTKDTERISTQEPCPHHVARTQALLTEAPELQDHNLGDCEVKQMCKDLRNLECKIPSLWLSDIDLTTGSTEDLTSDLKSHPLPNPTLPPTPNPVIPNLA
ncbi:nuclear factor 7, brain-like [Callorhinchus milii]|uniref:nuclear factor 7, brain-like n=1 Tax=Callorhinchus milii TaxID=7868 RepID=UPI001C3FD6AC|nr:nuclear factor 7, brain-like [Callorhinchus milii]